LQLALLGGTVMRTFLPNTVVVEVDPAPGEDGYDAAGPIVAWARGFLLGALLTAATLADALGHGWNAFPI
jgi:hypothetical protein